MRFESSVRVATAFFAALIGFGLKNILDSSETGGQQAHDLVTQKWPVFIIAVLFFLRFLLGSANHLWLEYVHREKIDDTYIKHQNALVALDIGFPDSVVLDPL